MKSTRRPLASLMAVLGIGLAASSSTDYVPRRAERQKRAAEGPKPAYGQASNPRRNAQRTARRLVKRGDQGQRPKFAKTRRHKPHHHPLRDEHGAYTLVGGGPFYPRRKWLAGISAQRGY